MSQIPANMLSTPCKIPNFVKPSPPKKPVLMSADQNNCNFFKKPRVLTYFDLNDPPFLGRFLHFSLSIILLKFRYSNFFTKISYSGRRIPPFRQKINEKT